MEHELTFRPAVRGDEAKIMFFVNGLAEYEKAQPGDVQATEELYTMFIFDEKKAEVYFICEDGKEVGFFLFFHNFSTWLGRPGLYLEDLFILPEYRGRGYGKKALEKMASIAKERDCGRFEWICLDWNEPSIKFYKKLGAIPQEEWTIYRVTGDTLTDMASRSDK